MRRLRQHLASLLYACANVEDDEHTRRALRRLASRIVPTEAAS